LDSIIEAIRALALTTALMTGNSNAVELLQPKQLRCVAVTAFAEARGEGERGMALVVQSMVNRRSVKGRSGCSIAQQSYDGYRQWKGKDPALRNREAWVQAQLTAITVVSGNIDLGDCAEVTHFLNPTAVRHMPEWASPSNRICRVGNHVAYKVTAI
jgi:spore germination cell wall hydrolase CwlJ-like protein